MVGEKKVYVLDTSVLMHDPQSIYAFEDNDVVIPVEVIDELDLQKQGKDIRNTNAREAVRTIKALIEKNPDFDKGIKLGPSLGNLIIEGDDVSDVMKDLKLKPEYKTGVPHTDNYLMARVAKKRKQGSNVILVTQDTSLYVRARSRMIEAQDYKHDKKGASFEQIISSQPRLTLDEKAILEFEKKGQMAFESKNLFTNQFVVLEKEGKDFRSWETNPTEYAMMRLARYVEGRLVKLKRGHFTAFGIKPRNVEQYFAMEALLDPEIHAVSLIGMAGTGKTLLALAAGIEQTVEDNKELFSYKKVCVFKPIVAVQGDIGYLPGDKEEKMAPWLMSIKDALDATNPQSEEKGRKKSGKEMGKYEYLTESGLLEVDALTHIRGRNMPEQFIIIEEAQNLTPLEVKSIVTRAAKNAKIVLTGDPYQIDTNYLDELSNGLIYTTNRLKGQNRFAYIVLNKTERSELAEIAARYL